MRPETDARLVQALDEYLAALEQGRAPPRDEFLSRHPELADDLRECLASLLLAVSLGSAFGLGTLSWLSDTLVRSTALESTAQQAEMREQVNNHYSALVA